MENVDIRLVIKRYLRKWYLFVLSFILCLGVAIFYLASTEKEYLVQSTLQLKDQSLGNKGAGEGKFLSGFGLLDSNSQLEDEVGILTSYSTVRQSLEGLGLEVSYFSYPDFLGSFGKVFSQESYPGSFSVTLNNAGWQLLNTPIQISFLGKEQMRVQVSSDNKPSMLYSPKTHKEVETALAIELDTIITVGQTLHTPYLMFDIEFIDPKVWESDRIYYFTISSLNSLTSTYQKKLKTETISENSNILKLSLGSAVPKKDIVFLNSLADVYIKNNVEKKNQLGQKTIQFIDFQLQGVSDSLRKNESSLQRFRANSQIINVEATSHKLSEQLFSLEEKQAQLSVQNKYYRYMADYLIKNDHVNDIVAPSSMGIDDKLLNSLLIQLSKLNEEKISKDFSSSQHNPVIQVLNRKIRSTKQALIDNIENLINSNEIGLNDASRRVAEIQKTINRLPQNERDLTDIKRRFTFNDNIYNYLLQKRAEAGIAIASNVPDKSVVDAPRQLSAGPVAPNTLTVLLMAVIMGFMIPLGFISLENFFQTKIESDEVLASWTSIPIVGQISRMKGKELKNTEDGQSYLVHAFRYLRQHVGILQLSHEVKTVGITSSKSEEGKTFCALHLANSFARAGKKTLLIEADLHMPMLSRNFKVNARPGLSDYLLGNEKKIIQSSGNTKLDIITSGSPVNNASDLLSTNQLGFLLSSLKEQYDIIIFDTPPLGIIADYLILHKHLDYTLLMVRQGHSERDEVKQLDKLVKRYELHAGIVYNGANRKINYYNGYYKS